MINTNIYIEELTSVEALKVLFQDKSKEACIALCSAHLRNEAIDLHFILWYCELMREAQTPEEITPYAMHWLTRFPDSVALVHEVSWVWLNLDDTFRAERLIRAALKIHGDELMLWCDLASVHFYKSHLDSATDCVEYVLARDARFAEALRIKARIAIKSGDQSSALEAVNKSLKEEPRNIDGLIMRGIIEDFGTETQASLNLKSSLSSLQIPYLLFLLGKRLCGVTGAILWLMFTGFLLIKNLGEQKDNWLDWILVPQLLIVLALIGWGLMMTTGSFIRHRLKNQDRRPIWMKDWIWTLVPILIWLLLTSIRYSLDDGAWSYVIDFIRTFAFCSIFPIYLWRRLRDEHRIASQVSFCCWCAVIILFIVGAATNNTSLFGMAHYFSAAVTLVYISFRHRW